VKERENFGDTGWYCNNQS